MVTLLSQVGFNFRSALRRRYAARDRVVSVPSRLVVLYTGCLAGGISIFLLQVPYADGEMFAKLRDRLGF